MGYAIPAPLAKDMDALQKFHRARYHFGRGFITPKDRVLDLGCGTGYGTEILSQVAKFVTGVDFDQNNINGCIKEFKRKNNRFICADLEKRKIPQCDVAISFENLEHLYKPKEFIARLKEKVKKFIVFSVPLCQTLVWDEERQEYHEKGDHTHKTVFANKEEVLSYFLDDTWKLLWTIQDGVTFMAVLYNENSL